jgi:ATP-dependent protease HslVU (ClpYQ) ATPase subunit
MAEAIAVVLTRSGHVTKEYIIAAEKAVSFAEIADLVSEITVTQPIIVIIKDLNLSHLNILLKEKCSHFIDVFIYFKDHFCIVIKFE